jgi:hypothetical protein
MYLDWQGEWQLPVLNGIASAPLLQDDGSIQFKDGYDSQSGLWCEKVPDIAELIPERPTREDAAAALLTLREVFKTFPFADAEISDADGELVVDTSHPPSNDESAFLHALLTGVCRPSLGLAPGIVLRAAPISGAGTGKGLLARCISIVAFGQEPHAVTAGADIEELEKRIGAELMEGGPVLYLDNLNDTSMKSDLLASAITERPSRARVLGKSQMVLLNSSALIILTGNGLTVSEDLARRFLSIELDARTENPETRKFRVDIKAYVKANRHQLLAAAMTIWRWGRHNKIIPSGMPLGSFEQWCRWVRDPLVALGCQDPAKRVHSAKERDTRRQLIAEFFAAWWDKHKGTPMLSRDLNEDVVKIIDPQGRGRQYVTSRLEKLTDSRVGGFVLTRQEPAGAWGRATYALTQDSKPETHRDHRRHREDSQRGEDNDGSDAPYAPYAFGHHEKKRAKAGATSFDLDEGETSPAKEGPGRLEL